jgi:hypothetical protein
MKGSTKNATKKTTTSTSSTTSSTSSKAIQEDFKKYAGKETSIKGEGKYLY